MSNINLKQRAMKYMKDNHPSPAVRAINLGGINVRVNDMQWKRPKAANTNGATRVVDMENKTQKSATGEIHVDKGGKPIYSFQMHTGILPEYPKRVQFEGPTDDLKVLNVFVNDAVKKQIVDRTHVQIRTSIGLDRNDRSKTEVSSDVKAYNGTFCCVSTLEGVVVADLVDGNQHTFNVRRLSIPSFEMTGRVDAEFQDGHQLVVLE